MKEKLAEVKMDFLVGFPVLKLRESRDREYEMVNIKRTKVFFFHSASMDGTADVS